MEERARLPESQIGFVSSTANNPTTTDQFAVNLGRNHMLKRFDVVTVVLEDQSRTHGVVTEIVNPTESPSHLANHMDTDIADLPQEPNTKLFQVNTATARVLSNSHGHDMPVPHAGSVYLATSADIDEALGIDIRLRETPQNMIAAGMLKLSNGTIARIMVDLLFLLGHEGAHMNVSGLPGLATKTSFLLFLISSILQHEERLKKKETAVIVLNSKKADLLQIDQLDPNLREDDRAAWQALGLEPRAFTQARYFLPRNDGGGANSFVPLPKDYEIYAFTLGETAEYLHLLFSHVSDPYHTISSTINEVRDVLRNPDDPLQNSIGTWEDLVQFLRSSTRDWRNIRSSSLGMVARHLRNVISGRGLFVSNLYGGGKGTKPERSMSDVVSTLRPGDVYVVDIANLRNHEQIMVVGSLLEAIDSIKADPEQMETFPPKVILYLDELGKYAPGSQNDAIVSKLLDIAERGRSTGQILFSAEQSRSTVNSRIMGAMGNSAIGVTGSAELSHSVYAAIPNEIKSTIPRLEKGEMVLVHPVFRFPVKIRFPRPAWRQ